MVTSITKADEVAAAAQKDVLDINETIEAIENSCGVVWRISEEWYLEQGYRLTL